MLPAQGLAAAQGVQGLHGIAAQGLQPIVPQGLQFTAAQGVACALAQGFAAQPIELDAAFAPAVGLPCVWSACTAVVVKAAAAAVAKMSFLMIEFSKELLIEPNHSK